MCFNLVLTADDQEAVSTVYQQEGRCRLPPQKLSAFYGIASLIEALCCPFPCEQAGIAKPACVTGYCILADAVPAHPDLSVAVILHQAVARLNAYAAEGFQPGQAITAAVPSPKLNKLSVPGNVQFPVDGSGNMPCCYQDAGL